MIYSWRLSLSATDKRYESMDRYEQTRRKLLTDVVDYTEEGTLRQGFMRDFLNFLKDLDFDLVKDGEDFYALFTRDMERKVDFSLDWPLATVVSGSKIQLLINPISFLFLKEREARALMKHEVMHLILDHHTREQTLSSRYSKLAINLAMDVAVNQYIKFLPPFAQKLTSVNGRLGLDLNFNETLEHYTAEIDRALAQNPRVPEQLKKETGVDYRRIHDVWKRGNDFKKEISKEKLEAMLRDATKAKIPEEMTSLIKPEGRPQLSWGDALRRAVTSMPAGRRKTVTRRNRRQPHRLDLKGELRDFVPEIIVAIDVSASIEDQDIRHYLTEILGITSNYRRTIRVIECDNQVRADYRIASVSDIRPASDRRGGTAFSPVFELLSRQGGQQGFLIYFTDGQGEKTLTVKPRHQTLWVVTGKSLSLDKPYGQVVYLHETKVQDTSSSGLEAMRDLLHEWAR